MATKRMAKLSFVRSPISSYLARTYTQFLGSKFVGSIFRMASFQQARYLANSFGHVTFHSTRSRILQSSHLRLTAQCEIFPFHFRLKFA